MPRICTDPRLRHNVIKSKHVDREVDVDPSTSIEKWTSRTPSAGHMVSSMASYGAVESGLSEASPRAAVTSQPRMLLRAAKATALIAIVGTAVFVLASLEPSAAVPRGGAGGGARCFGSRRTSTATTSRGSRAPGTTPTTRARRKATTTQRRRRASRRTPRCIGLRVLRVLISPHSRACCVI